MQEYLSDAVVLSREPSGEFDLRISLFTKKFGKISGKTKSARKITSKLSGHVEPGNLVRARVVEKNGFQIVDALKIGKVDVKGESLEVLGGLLHDGEAEPGLWALITSKSFSWRNALRFLGWDPEAASCSRCGRKAEAFFVSRQDFFCRNCASGFGRNEVIYL
jgi:recombinational DNA repair protein (RecF pathway)